MLYLIGEIAFWLLIGVIFGFIVGWILRGQLAMRNLAEISKKPVNVVAIPKQSTPKQFRSQTEKDNLKRISGIGPYLESRLNEMGIYTFRQISELDKNKIIEISNTIGSFPDRIIRDKWVEQAEEFTKNGN